ncbi:MAG: hypothetical protein JO038_06355, partial [Alphaproteobacteria bacterium]|nr:hypothetical protein [Alphaproteobacteria bacterium]
MAASAAAVPRTGFVPLAWRNLLANKRRLVRSSVGIGFAVLLMLVQLGFERAFFDASLAVIRQLDGDLFILSATKYRFGAKAPFPRHLLYQAGAVAGLASARPLYGDWQDFFWRSPGDDKIYLVQAFAFDPDEPVFLLADVEAGRERLKPADTVLVDRRARRFLGMSEGALQTELAQRTVRVVGTLALGPDFASDGTVMMSSETYAKLLPGGSQGDPLADVEVGVLKLRSGGDMGAVAGALRAALPSTVVVMTKPELIRFESRFQAEVSSAGPIFAMGT